MNFAKSSSNDANPMEKVTNMSLLNILLSLFLCLTVISCGKQPSIGSFAGQILSGIHNEATSADLNGRYTVTSTMEILKPIKIESMNTDAQRAEVISENDRTVTVKITVNPVADQISTLAPNPTWKQDYAADENLKKYLSPGITTNWDEEMRSELLSALAKSNIFPDQLSDIELVKKVSAWIFSGQAFKFQDHFISYDVEFLNGTPNVIPELRDHFNSEKSKNYFADDNQALAQGIYGKAMFRSRKFGNCTYSATLQATVLKALGIPTRLVLMVPAIDWNDQAQWNMIHENLHQFAVRKKVLEGLALQSIGSWGSHTFNEVYVGHKWVRLNYTNLGQTPADPQFFGLMLQVNQMSDWSEANLGKTWGVHAQSRNITKLSSNNPYRSLKISDAANVLNPNNNPSVDFPEIKTVLIEKSFNADDASLPPQVRQNLFDDQSFAVTFNSHLPAPAFNYIAMFRRNVSPKFTLKAQGYPDVIAYLSGSWTEAGFTAFKIKPYDMSQMVKDVSYTLVPETVSGPYHWETASNLIFSKPSRTTSVAPVTPAISKPLNAFKNTATVLNARIVTSEMKCPTNKICVVLELAENINVTDLNSLNRFCAGVSMKFTFTSESTTALSPVFYGVTGVNNGQNVGLVFTVENSAMKLGAPYKVSYDADPVQGEFNWVLPRDLTVVRK